MTTLHTHAASSDCQSLLSQLNDYADGELSAQLCQELEAHLAHCENCSIVLDTLHKTIYLVRHLNSTPPRMPLSVENRLFAILDLQDFLDQGSD